MANDIGEMAPGGGGGAVYAPHGHAATPGPSSRNHGRCPF